MKKELELSLVEKYPNLYRDLYGKKGSTLLSYGLAVGDGWYPLINELSARLESIILAAPEGSPNREIRAFQVKEKFGSLRYYLSGSYHEEMEEVISEFENKSAAVCEQCGEPGKERLGAWIKTLCEGCHATREKKRLEDAKYKIR